MKTYALRIEYTSADGFKTAVVVEGLKDIQKINALVMGHCATTFFAPGTAIQIIVTGCGTYQSCQGMPHAVINAAASRTLVGRLEA